MGREKETEIERNTWYIHTQMERDTGGENQVRDGEKKGKRQEDRWKLIGN